MSELKKARVFISKSLVEDLREEMESIFSGDDLHESRRNAAMAAFVIIGQWSLDEGWTENMLMHTFLSSFNVGRGGKVFGEEN